MPRSLVLLCFASLAAMGCKFPRPQKVEVTFELGPKEVLVDATFADLRLPPDPLHGFQALGMLVTPERARRVLEPKWVSKVDLWELGWKDGAATLHAKVRANRVAFEACLNQPCNGELSDACEFLPLNRACMPTWFDELKHPDGDAYEDTGRSTKAWRADTQKFVLSLRRVPSARDEYPAPAAPFEAMFRDAAGALATLQWMDELGLASPSRLEPWAGPVAFHELRAEALKRHRDHAWYLLLRTFEPRWLTAGPDADWAEPALRVEEPKPTGALIPAGPLPAKEWQWQARAAYEISRSDPGARAQLDQELCGAAAVAKRKDYQRFCAFVRDAPAKIKAASPGKAE